MPSHKIHIAIGVKLNQKLNFNKDLFYIGCILPDLDTVSHSVAHFKNSHRKYDTNRFIDKYYDKNDPIILGYLVHILTDEYYNKFVRENKFTFDENNKLNGIKLKDKIFYGTPNEVTLKKQDGFYEYDKYLINNDFMPTINYIDLDKLTYIKECNYDKNDIFKYIDTYNDWIKEKNLIENYDIFSFDELDKLFYDCYYYIDDFIEKLNNKE